MCVSHDLSRKCYAFIHKKLFLFLEMIFFSLVKSLNGETVWNGKNCLSRFPSLICGRLFVVIFSDYLTIHQSPPNNTLHRNLTTHTRDDNNGLNLPLFLGENELSVSHGEKTIFVCK